MAANNFETSLLETLAHEGGWSDHPSDPGGATNMGITLSTFRAWHKNDRLTANDLRTISMNVVRAIYRAEYWNVVHADELPAGVDHMVFDMAVNAGPRRSASMLQEAVGLSGRQVDGVVGPITLAATRAQDQVVTIGALGEAHELHYRSLTSLFPIFGRGWLNRLERRLRHAQGLLAT